MRRTLLCCLAAAIFGFPAVSFAKVTVGVIPPPRPVQRLPHVPQTLGAGITSNVPGHVTGPGVVLIDNDVRAPINDVQPGRGTNDAPQSKNPPPAH